MIDAEEENWRDRDESLGFAVLEATTVERARKANFCMRKKERYVEQREGKLFIRSG
jgi:hypothetical protein